MKKQHHVIYVPGILDDIYRQKLIVKSWRLYGVHGHCHVMPWLGSEAYEPKFQRLLDEIDSYKAKGHKVSLIGLSAGATVVLNAYVERRDAIRGVVFGVAKINYPEKVDDRIYAANPAFKTSIQQAQDNLKKLTDEDKAKMHSFYSPGDNYITHADTVIPGVRESRLPALRHGLAITYCLTAGAPRLLRPLKKLANQ